jgi:putative membrane protein
MPRLLAQMSLSLLSNALALLAASMLLTGFAINGLAFVVAVCIFTASTVILEPLITKIARQNAPYLLGGIALVTTFVGLLVTTLVTDGLSITGIGTWVIATLVIWLAAVLAGLVLPRFLFKEVLGDHRKAKK